MSDGDNTSRPRRRYRRRDEAFWAKARALWDQGYNARQIGKELGIWYSAVEVHAKTRNWPKHPNYRELLTAWIAARTTDGA